MKMTLKEANERFVQLAGMGKMVFPSKLSFAVAYNLEKLEQEANRAEKERERLCKQYADKDKDGEPVMESYLKNGTEQKQYKMNTENSKAFEEEYKALLETEVEIDILMVGQEVFEQCEERERYSIPSVGVVYALAFMTK